MISTSNVWNLIQAMLMMKIEAGLLLPKYQQFFMLVTHVHLDYSFKLSSFETEFPIFVPDG